MTSRIYAVALMEMRSSVRGKAFFIARTVWAAIAALSVFQTVMMWEGMLGQNGEVTAPMVGVEAFDTLGLLHLGILFLAGVLLGAESILRERIGQTLHLLLSSRLRAWEILVGKWAAFVVLLFGLSLALLPILAMLSWLGGIDLLSLLGFILATLLISGFGISVGQLGAAVARTREGASLTISLFMVLFMVSEEWLGIRWLERIFELAFSVFAYDSIPADDLIVVLGMFSQNLVPIVLALVLTAILLPHSVQRRTSQQSGLFVTAAPREEALRGNPVTWISRRSSVPRFGDLTMGLFYTTCVLATLGAGTVFYPGPGAGPAYVPFLANVFLPPFVTLTMLATGVVAWGNDMENRSLPALLATPLSARKMLLGKLDSERGILLLLLTLPGVYFLPAVLQGDLNAALVGISFGLELLALALCTFLLGNLCVFYFKGRIKAILAGIAALIGWQILKTYFLFFVISLASPFFSDFIGMFFSAIRVLGQGAIGFLQAALLFWISVRIFDRALGRST